LCRVEDGFPDHLGGDLNALKSFNILIPLLLLPRKVYSNHGRKKKKMSLKNGEKK
jgi:hypothetical protein